MRATALVIMAAGLIAACGSGSAAVPRRGVTTAAAFDATWPQFGHDPQRSNASDTATGVPATRISSLRRQRVALPGTADSSPVYAHGTFVITTSYGRTLAIDAASGLVRWQFVPPGIDAWEGTRRFTNTSPALDPDGHHVFAASPDGRIHRLDLATGAEARGWPVSVTRDPIHEKLSAALGILDGHVLVATAGYFGDAPPYQGHVVSLNRESGRIAAVFNTLCANRHRLLDTAHCASSDAGIWSRAGVVAESGGRRVLVSTGNGPYDGRTNFGDSVLELTAGLRLRRTYTPDTQAKLNSGDIDLGSSAPAVLPGRLVLIGGKDGLLRLLDLRRLSGRGGRRPYRTGGELQSLSNLGHTELFTQPAVWHRWVFVGDGAGTAAYELVRRRLRLRWHNDTPATSPVVAGGLLYMYNPGGGLNVYEPRSGRRLGQLPAGTGHWSSPIIAGGHVALTEGNANARSRSGVLDIYSP